jgi:hypothetical protein
MSPLGVLPASLPILNSPALSSLIAFDSGKFWTLEKVQF